MSSEGWEVEMSFIGSMDRWTGFGPQAFREAAIRAIPCARARVVVTIDGRPYAGFADRATAEEAVKLWSGEVIDEDIRITPRRAAPGWAAVRGRTLGIVER
jgi:hypothetical protein